MAKRVPELSITPFLMFSGNAEEAINLYVEVFPNSKVESIDKYGTDDGGPEGTVRLATVSLNGQKVMCIDSPVKHDFSFTPATSLYVACDDVESIERYFNVLSNDGQVLMPLGEYPFSRKYAWVTDRFGVSWQLAAT